MSMKNLNKIVAVIPVKHSSERVKSKNFREFSEGKSLFEIKLDQIISSNSFDEIYISSDSPDAKEIATKKGVHFIDRDEKFCNNITPWSDTIFHVANSIPEENDVYRAWCHTTSPLFDEFKKAVATFNRELSNGNCNGLVSVSECKDFILDDLGNPVNYSWGRWHKYSQDLRSYYYVSGALFISSKEEMLLNRYVISTNPFLFVSSQEKSIDIDTEFDYEFAQYLFDQ